MYRLPCPHCQSTASVAASRAGDRMPCPSCGEEFVVPKLGDLRQLHGDTPGTANAEPAGIESAAGSGRSLAFVAFGVLGIASLLVAAYCGVRWALIDVPYTTDSHLAEVATLYLESPPAQLIREYEQMEELGIDMAMPLRYQVTADTRREWGLNASVAGLVGLAAVGTLVVLGASRKRGDEV